MRAKINGKKKSKLEFRTQQPEVTPVVPFKNKIQYYQLKQSFLITP
jgi:hypothetical protein